jgi:type II secretion system protein H
LSGRIPTPPPRAARAFTLIELMAVVAIFALFLAFVAPNLGTLSSRYLDQQALRLQGALEYAREAAVVSARPHHFVLDLDASTYQILGEAPPSELADAAQGAAAPAAELPPQAPGPQQGESRGPISLAPPAQPEVELVPVRGPLGSQTQLLEEIHFAGVQTEEGWAERGRIEVGFGPDGVAQPALIVLEHESGARAGLEVLPLLESVRVLGEEELASR